MAENLLKMADLVGTWRLVGYAVKTKKELLVWTAAATGILIYSTEGYMSAVLNFDHDKVPEGTRKPDRVTLCYAGRVEITNGVITHHVIQASDPTWLGRKLERFPTWLEDGKLRLEGQGTLGRGIITWERVGL